MTFDDPQQSQSAVTRAMQSPWFLPSALALLVVALFGGVLLGPSNIVLSQGDADLATAFAYFRQFGFDQLRAGHLALWNPHLFSGTPFLGNWQSALLYPPNWIYLVLPLDRAINIEIAVHVFIAGLGMALWTRQHGMHPAASLMACAIVMLGGPFFMNVTAGHMASIDAMAWAPFVLLAVDGLLDNAPNRRRGFLKWGLLAAFALTMMILAGHPQTVFNTMVTVIVYMAIRLGLSRTQWPAALVLAGAGALAAGIAAAQIVAGLDAASEGTRRGGVPFEFASMLSLPPENLLTTVAPGIFGDIRSFPYWGRWYFWEVCFFIGVIGLPLAIFGLLQSRSRLRGAWAAMAIIPIVLALGGYTPLFSLLYHHVPGFNRFRSSSRFIYDAALFLALAAAAGLDALIRGTIAGRDARATSGMPAADSECDAGVPARESVANRKPIPWLAGIVGIIGGGLVTFGFVLRAVGLGTSEGSAWQKVIWNIWSTHETFQSGAVVDTPTFFEQSQTQAGTACLIAGATAVILGLLVAGTIRRPRLAYGVLVLGLVELFAFAHSNVTTFDLTTTSGALIRNITNSDPGDYRILQMDGLNVDQVMNTPTSDLWGYDPTVLGRYAEYMTYSQGGNPADATMYLTFHRGSRMLTLFRIKYAIRNRGGQITVVPIGSSLPHALLLQNVVEMHGRDRILAALNTPGFDFSKTAIVETQASPSSPPLLGAGGASGTIDVTEDYPGRLTIHADVPRNAVALITDPYSRDWRATPLPGSSQSRYDVVPADYAAMAIPLNAGKHVIRLEYVPAGFQSAVWISILSTLLFFVLLVVVYRPSDRRLKSRLN